MAEPSIHYRRRYFYALWTGLLLLSAGALALWERPARTDLASLRVHLEVAGAPEGTRIQAWAGPAARWPGSSWTGEGAFAEMPLGPDGRATLPVVRLAIARRRWIKDYIPRRTADLVMVRLSPPSGPARFYALPCSRDIHLGILRPHWRQEVSISGQWNNLPVDGTPSNRVP